MCVLNVMWILCLTVPSSLAGWIFPPPNNHPFYSRGAIKGQGSQHKVTAIYGHVAVYIKIVPQSLWYLDACSSVSGTV